MGVRISDLRQRAQPIAKNFRDCGFSMVDLISVGILSLEGKTPNEISDLIKGLAPDSKDLPEIAATAARYMIKVYEGMNSEEIAVSLTFLSNHQSAVVQNMINSLTVETTPPKEKSHPKTG